MCIGCDIGHIYPYLDDYLSPYHRATQIMKQTERGLLRLSKLDMDNEYKAVLDRNHKRLVRIRREWGRAEQALAKDIALVEEKRELERKRIESLGYGPAIEG